jgi:hypothetical protein
MRFTDRVSESILALKTWVVQHPFKFDQDVLGGQQRKPFAVRQDTGRFTCSGDERAY